MTKCFKLSFYDSFGSLWVIVRLERMGFAGTMLRFGDYCDRLCRIPGCLQVSSPPAPPVLATRIADRSLPTRPPPVTNPPCKRKRSPTPRASQSPVFPASPPVALPPYTPDGSYRKGCPFRGEKGRLPLLTDDDDSSPGRVAAQPSGIYLLYPNGSGTTKTPVHASDIHPFLAEAQTTQNSYIVEDAHSA